MKRRWLITLCLGVALLVCRVVPALAGFEGGDPGLGKHEGWENPNNNHNDPDHGPKP
ncbi:MAG TPA: hypothetical protein VGX97_12060 [bacterium]|nr:hypothetical protein [bacterium]